MHFILKKIDDTNLKEAHTKNVFKNARKKARHILRAEASMYVSDVDTP